MNIKFAQADWGLLPRIKQSTHHTHLFLPLLPFMIVLEKPRLCIMISEECGYRYWKWYPNMSKTELIEWWQNIKDVWVYCENPNILPGQLINLTSREFSGGLRNRQVGSMHLHTNEDSVLVLNNQYYYKDNS